MRWLQVNVRLVHRLTMRKVGTICKPTVRINHPAVPPLCELLGDGGGGGGGGEGWLECGARE